MNTFMRLMIVLALVAGIALLARENTAWAEGSSDQSLSAEAEDKAPQGGMSSFADRKDDDCIKGRGKHHEKCKDKGSVKPPPKQTVIPVTGEYSIGGFCTLRIVLNDPQITLNGSIQEPLPGKFPPDVQKVRQGCLLTYYSSNQRIEALSPSAGNATICFAAQPKKQMTLYFYNLYSPSPAWSPLETTVQDGVACAAGVGSGLYIGTFRQH